MGILKFFSQDKIKVGLLLSLLCSLVLMAIVWVYHCTKFDAPLLDFKLLLTLKPQVFTVLAAVCIIFNTILFAYLNYLRQYAKSKGVFIATLVLGLSIFLLKLYIINFQF